MNSELNAVPAAPDWLNLVQHQVETTRFGIVQIVVHDSRVVQIDRTEKVRFEGAGQPAASTSQRPNNTSRNQATNYANLS